MEKKPTIKTIAEIAGVSHVAVSKALRGCSDISEKMAEKIKEIAKEVGYIPNAAARNLSLKKTNTIGMIVPEMGNHTSYSDIFNYISAAAARKGLNVILGSCNRDIELEKLFCKNMCESRVGVLIVASMSSEVTHIKEICKDIVPVIFIGGKTGLEQENCITMDYKHSGKLVVNYFYERGHRDIALFLYYPENRTITQKLDGYIETMNDLGLEPRVYWHGNSSDTFNAGSELVERLINSNELPTAIWCASDIMALGVINALQEHGINVPEEVSVIGHDDLFFSALKSISLTTLSLPKEEIGLKVVDISIKLMEGKSEGVRREEDYKRVFNSKLIERNTTIRINAMDS